MSTHLPISTHAAADWVRLWVRAARLPFLSASILPYMVGATLAGRFDIPQLLLGLAAVALGHVSANLLNDYADSRTGADWICPTYFEFFGGSQLIQAGLLSERAYLEAAGICAAGSVAAVALAAWRLGSPAALGWLVVILLLAWGYSHRPLRLVARGLGETVIFLLFGPATVLGGYYLQTGVIGAWEPLAVSVPLGLAVTAVLVANEFPDRRVDAAAGKRTLVVRLGRSNGLLLYMALWGGVAGSIGVAVETHAIHPMGLSSLLGVVPAVLAGRAIAAKTGGDRADYLMPAKLTLTAQTLTALGLLLGSLWR